ncbi:DUF6807 family protein [Sinomicrobium oceani]|uniref:DUF6807 family protein n=1 Tax=Sinomicrobium oceani TaxID=1150368 RepID=UPI00227A4282|nr:DUF6807 family protein [Sinomicrobium oceani]
MPYLKNVCSLLLFSMACFLCYAQQLHFEQENDIITLYDGTEPCFSYQIETKTLKGKYGRANYIHPLYDRNGVILTEDFPKDHPHHRGIFWTWHQLFARGERMADPWLCEGITWDVDNVHTEIKEHSAILHTVVYWMSGRDKDQPVIRENGTITYTRNGDYDLVDFDITLTALTNDVKIGGSEDEKGYSGFSPRIRPGEGLTFFNTQGEVSPKNTPVKAGGWIEAVPNYDTSKKEQVRIVMMCNPETLPSFQGWILRKDNSMQNAAFPGRTPISIPKDQPLHFRNALLIHSGTLTAPEVTDIYNSFFR